MTYLPDVNVLVALVWPQHIHHKAAHTWFAGEPRDGWATCALTQTGLVRVSSNPRIIRDARTPVESHALLGRIVSHPGHSYWDRSVDLSAHEDIPAELLQGHTQVTDVYLLLLATFHDGVLATFDRRLERAAAGTRLADHIRRIPVDD